MSGAAKMTKVSMPMLKIPEPPTELRINAKKFPQFKNHKIGDKINISGKAEVHHINAGKDYHDVTLHIKSLDKGDSNAQA